MIQISKTYSFDAAHVLTEHEGKCSRLHGHTYRLTVTLAQDESTVHAKTGSERGMVMDYGKMDSVIRPLIDERLDHYFLNESLPVYPTAENMAKWIFDQLQPLFLSSWLVSVTVRETENTSATYGSG